MNSEDMSQLLPQTRLELPSPVGGNSGGHAIPRNSPTHKGTGNGLNCDVNNGECFRPSGESVNAREQIAETIRGRQGTDVHMVETCSRGGECRERGDSVSLNL